MIRFDGTTRCAECGLPLDPEKGEVFVQDDGSVTCNDHDARHEEE